MESFATPYPIIFHDGEREHDKGQVGVHSVLTFNRFQALLSQKVGLPASQLSAVFVCKRTTKDTDKRQKLPINENTNFNIILNQHNPMWEKDCHFLVSLKKSKKERKGTRRRNAEAEYGDYDSSVSPRGGTSSPDEQSKSGGSIQEESKPDSSSSSPDKMRRSPESSPLLMNLANKKFNGTKVPDGKNDREIILLTGDHTGSSSQSGWRSQSQMDKPVNSVSNGCPQEESHFTQGLSLQPATQPLRPQHVVTQGTDKFHDRQSDVVPARSPILLHRKGILNLSGTPSPSPLFSQLPATRSGMHPSTPSMLQHRLASGITGLASGTNAALTLQEAQAQYLNSQSHHTDHMHLRSQALSKMRGVVRGRAAYETGTFQTSGVCQHCCNFRERNIDPTPFHLCVHDRITLGFRGPSPAGPIERPTKRAEAGA